MYMNNLLLLVLASSTSSDDDQSDPIMRAVNAAKQAARVEALKTASNYMKQSAAAAAGVNAENGVPIYLDNLFNPAKFNAPDEICTIWMKVPMEADDDKENRQISLNTMEEKVNES